MRTISIWMAGLLAGCGVFGGESRLSLEEVADELVTYEVVFLGEEHDNRVGHVQHYELFKLLHHRNPSLVLSMEMFERDVQPTLDAYLAGEIEEEAFLEESRPWGNYQRDYRPFVEFAKRNGLRVVAANAPKPLVSAMRKGEVELGSDPSLPRTFYAPRDAYWEEFQAAMSDHPGMSEDELFAVYRAQCLWDDTMAESIADALQASVVGTQVVHVCGKFHSDDGLGTVLRLSRLKPGVRHAILTMETRPNIERTGEGRFRLIAPPQPEPIPDEEGDDEEGEMPAVDDVSLGRPALGFMPDYQSADGLGVAEVVLDGPCDRAGIEPGDVILRVAGSEVFDVESYMLVLGDLTIGETVEVVVDHGAGEPETFEVKVGSRSH